LLIIRAEDCRSRSNMPGLIEDYAVIGNCESAALVSRDGSIDWLALPRFDSAACFAALLGDPKNGRWQIAPDGDARVTRRYRDSTLILETRFETSDGVATVVDCMGRRDGCADLVRLVRGERGRGPAHHGAGDPV
jgi:GH15 family glucan-1,4-alpha-glucosidase